MQADLWDECDNVRGVFHVWLKRAEQIYILFCHQVLLYLVFAGQSKFPRGSCESYRLNWSSIRLPGWRLPACLSHCHKRKSKWQLPFKPWNETQQALPVTVSGERSLNTLVFISTHELPIIFSLPCLAEEERDRVALVGWSVQPGSTHHIFINLLSKRPSSF